jgi:hypothetical protein
MRPLAARRASGDDLPSLKRPCLPVGVRGATLAALLLLAPALRLPGLGFSRLNSSAPHVAARGIACVLRRAD